VAESLEATAGLGGAEIDAQLVAFGVSHNSLPTKSSLRPASSTCRLWNHSSRFFHFPIELVQLHMEG
jgi:hypothetical protein